MTSVTAEIDEEVSNRIAVDLDYRLKDKLKKDVPGAKWDANRRIWTIPLSWTSCLALRVEFGDQLSIGPALMEWAMETKSGKQELAELRSRIDIPESVDTAELALHKPGFSDLHPYQLLGGFMGRLAEKYLFTDETGTGKSRTALASLSLLVEDYGHDAVFPCLIIAPLSVVPGWKYEIENFFPDADVRLVTGTPSKQKTALEPGGDFYVMNYEALRKYSRIAGWGSIALKPEEKTNKEVQALGIKSFIADEAHRAKSPKAAQTRALWGATEGARFRFALTGTPIQDTPEDMWSILHLIAPHEYPNKTSYVERYLDVVWNTWGGREVNGIKLSRQEEFFANLDTRMRRITKEVALPFLPDKVYQTRWVTLPPKLRKAYNDMAQSLVAELETGTLAADSVLVRASRLVQLASAFGEVLPDGSFNMIAPSPKIDAFMDDVKAGDYDGHQVVVFSDSVQLINLLDTEMKKSKMSFGRITGAEDSDTRQAAIESFQRGELQYMLITKAAAEGVTLTAADIMVRLVRPWSLTVHKQAEDRVHRIGSETHESVTFIDYISQDTVDEAQIVRLNAKEARAQDVLRDGELLAMIKGEAT
jgi:SNF2 family DNA or RNA helicase